MIDRETLIEMAGTLRKAYQDLERIRSESQGLTEYGNLSQSQFDEFMANIERARDPLAIASSHIGVVAGYLRQTRA